MQDLVTENELHALVDGQLSPERMVAVQAWLASHPEEAARVDAWARQRAALRARHAAVLDEPLPMALLRAAKRPDPALRRWHRPWLWQMAASVVMVLAGGVMGWGLHGVQRSAAPAQIAAGTPQRMPPLARDAAMAYAVFAPDQGRPVEITAEHEALLVTWLSKRMAAPMRPPDLQTLGYQLEGGRLLAGSNGPVAQFMYADAADMRLTVYIAREGERLQGGAGSNATPTTAFQFARDGAVNVFYWIDGPFGYAISSYAGRTELARVSQVVFKQLGLERTSETNPKR